MTNRKIWGFQDSQPAHVQDPAWITDMQSHFAKTGSYRGADVRRVLGDPREGVSINCVSSEAANLMCAAPKKELLAG